MKTIKIEDYKQYQKIITYVTTYQGSKTLKTGDVLSDKDLKSTMFVDGQLGKKLTATSLTKDDATIYDYITKRDKLNNTVSRYTQVSNLIDKDITKDFRGLMNDITNRLMNGDITAEQAQKSIELAKKSITA